jgi:hypothetical protein
MLMLMLLQQMLTKNVDILLVPRQKNVAVETTNVVDIVDAIALMLQMLSTMSMLCNSG